MHETEDTEIKTEPLPGAAGHLACALASPGASSSPSFLSQGLQPAQLLFPEPLPPLGTCGVLLILRPQPEAPLGERAVGLQAAAGLPRAPGACAAPGLGRRPCDCKLSEAELMPALCSVHLPQQRRLSLRGGPRRGAQARKHRRCVAGHRPPWPSCVPAACPPFEPDLELRPTSWGRRTHKCPLRPRRGRPHLAVQTLLSEAKRQALPQGDSE